MTSRIPAPFRVIGRAIVDWWDSWLDMVLMILVGFFASLTVILFPPVVFGIYYAAHSTVNGESMGLRGMIQGARKYFWKSLLWGIINLFVAFLAYINIQFYSNITAIWGIYLLAVIALLIYLWIAANFYGLAYFMEQSDHSLKVAFRNGLLTTLAAPLFTFVMMLLVLIVAALCVFIIPVFLALPGIIVMLGYRAMYNRLEVFGKREPEKTPKEIEAEESERVHTVLLGRAFRDDLSGDLPAGREIANGEGDVKKGE